MSQEIESVDGANDNARLWPVVVGACVAGSIAACALWLVGEMSDRPDWIGADDGRYASSAEPG
jgi:hypothetical protein